MKQTKNHILRDLGMVVCSVAVAVLLARTGWLEGLLASAQEWRLLGSLVAGMFFVSIFTAAPAGVVLFEIAAASSIWEVALFGGIGALIGDLLIFRFIKDSLSEDIAWLLRKTKRNRLKALSELRVFRWLIPLTGAIIVASPFPDEIGLAMMGLSKMKTSVFIPVSFSLNFIGILLIGMLAGGV